jgi:hypothetical protein
MKRTDWAVAAVLAACALTLAACGGGSDSGGGTSPAARDEAGLEFASCMREHGVDMPDPEPGGGILIGGPGSKVDPSSPVTKRAMAACQGKIEAAAPKPTPGQEEELKEQALSFAQCMREHGVDMPDPKIATGGKLQMTAPGHVEASSPAFRAAQKACQGEMPGLATPPTG